VVHNGIIENFRALRAGLAAEGVTCATATDTEVVAQLVAHAMAGGMSPVEAVAATLPKLEGAFALAFLFENEPDLMIGARHGSPLAVGWGEDEMFLGSDALALSPMTARITYLDEGDWVVLHRSGAEVFDRAGRPVERAVQTVSVEAGLADKGGYKHFMLKEIHEQPAVLADVLGRYLTADRSMVSSPAETIDWAALPRLLIVACGTASYAGMVAKYWFERFAGLPVELDIASEFRYRDAPLTGDEAALFISQSGETADTLAALRHVAGRVQHTIGILNITESTIGREADLVLPTLAGREIGVASTKAFTCQLMTLACTAILAARQRGRIDAGRERAMVAALMEVPRLVAEVLAGEPRIAAVAHEVAGARDILYLGRGAMFPIALEGALKLKEISYIHAEGYASGELKHGPIALIDETVPVVVMAPKDELFDKTASNMQEVVARGGQVVLITDPDGEDAAADGAWRVLRMPACDPLVAPLVYSVPAQLLAYHAALAKGTDVDQPRNLAKSVTVE
jgi:glucosamine--fructose-6-phosphate aminotransferase (isomerizing)